MLTDEEKKSLLKIARDAATAGLRREPVPKVEVESAALAMHCGAFVTLHNHGALRGCIGQFEADRPLYSMVQEMAVAAATRDPRFSSDPVTPAELADIDIEISAISPMKRLENPLDIELGRDGIYIRSGYATGCFLPQVATETGWTKEEFLSHCCTGKAGIDADAWKDPETEVHSFTAEVFGEKERG